MTTHTCPFKDTEKLASIADNGAGKHQSSIEERLKKLKTEYPQLIPDINYLDALYLATINEVQNETIRQMVCPNCTDKEKCPAQS